VSKNNQSPPPNELDQPLAMTVFDMTPAPDTERRVRNGRLKMIFVLLICAAPVIASYLTYYVFRPEGRRNYGELIDPQQPLPAVTVLSADGTAVELPSLKDQWLLVSVAPSNCPAVCEQNLYLQRQLRESMGREKMRVDWVWLRTDEEPIPERLSPALTEATVLAMSANEVKAWLKPAPGQTIEDHLYVVDPLGNWMMRFPAMLDAKKARKDLEHLLKASSSWDREGRER
jgi:cytochrome oxidase Cu insertion factor (SCO1/SenC/PrrC family)